ncbi:hypothetical protein TNCV_4773691 [Trichonephila clavipes]|nr:hypothetical protein TNCV_4773691 [Trichonephila clavipes]
MPNNHTTWPFMTAVDFLHHENPPTWAGVEPATLGADGQRQTNYVTQSALDELLTITAGLFYKDIYITRQQQKVRCESLSNETRENTQQSPRDNSKKKSNQLKPSFS